MAAKRRFSESQTSVRVKPGEEFSIELAGTPGGTGAGWQLVGERDQVEFVGESSEPASDRYGAPETQAFTFRAPQAGTATLTFEYGRPWEAGNKPIHQVAVKVVP